MKLIDRLVLGIFLRMFLGTLAVLLTLFEVISFFDIIDDFVAHHAEAKLVILYFIFKLPEAIFNMSPMAVLIGAILAFSFISRSREVIIMMGSGLSVWRIAAPVLGAAMIISGLNFLNGEHILPPSWKRSKNIFDYEIRKKERKTLTRQNQIWMKANEETIWNIDFFDVKTGILHNIISISFQPNRNGFASIMTAKSALMEDGVWVLKEGLIRNFNPDNSFVEEKFDIRKIHNGPKIIELKEAEKLPQEMNFAEIREYVKRIREAGYDDTAYTVDMHKKVSFPLICLVMAFLAIPFSIKTSRAANTLMGVTIGVFLGFIFWFFQSMGISLGHSGKLNPLIAVWFSHIGFTLFALYMTSAQYGVLPYRISRLFKKIKKAT